MHQCHVLHRIDDLEITEAQKAYIIVLHRIDDLEIHLQSKSHKSRVLHRIDDLEKFQRQ